MRGRTTVLAALALTALAAAAPLSSAVAAAVPDGGVALVDRPTGFGPLPFDGMSESGVFRHALSRDGCYLTFSSSNDVLMVGDEDSATNVYRLDRCSPGTPVVQVNRTQAGLPAAAGSESFNPSISADGRYVAFTTNAENLVPGAADRYEVVVKDLQDGSVEIVSRGHGSAGALAPAAFYAVISGNGRAVAFSNYGALDAANVDGASGVEAIYVRYLNADQTYMASTDSGGAEALGVNGVPDIDQYGAHVAFLSTAPLTTADTDSEGDAYVVRNIGAAQTPELASFTVGNVSGSQSASAVALSTDGQTVGWTNDRPWWATCTPGCSTATQADFPAPGGAGVFARHPAFGYSLNGVNHDNPVAPSRLFWTTESSLVAGDTNTAEDVYARLLSDLTSSGLSLLTTGGYDGGAGNGEATDDGAVVAFVAGDPALPAGTGADPQIYVRAGGTTTLVSGPAGGGAPRAGEVGNSGIATLHQTSADGRYVVFTSSSSALGAPLLDHRHVQQVLRRDVVTGATTLVSVMTGGTAVAASAFDASIDAAGRRVAFVSSAGGIVPGVVAGTQHLYVRDLQTGQTRLVDQVGGTPLAGGVRDPQLAGGGGHAVFAADDPALPGYSAGTRHVYEANLTTGAIVIVDRNAAGTIGNRAGETPDVSDDGSRVAFVSRALNLRAVPTAAHTYVKDLGTGALLWASEPESKQPLDADTSAPAISGDGKVVAFVNRRTTFGFGARPGNTGDVFVHDLATGATTRVSVGTGAPADADDRDASISADGRRVAFVQRSTGSPARVYVRDRAAGTTTAVKPGARFGAYDASLAANGSCIALGSRSNDLVSPGYGPDFDHVYLAALGTDCPPAAPPAPAPGDGGPGGSGTPGGGGAGGGAAAAAGGAGAAATDKTAPALSAAKMTNTRFAVAAGATALSAATKTKRGTAFTFTLSEDATTTIAIARKTSGRRSKARCVKPRKGLTKKCTRLVVAATLRRAATKAGANRVPFTGRIGRKALKPGSYVATIVATDAAGNRSAPRALSFRIVRRQA